MNIYEIEIEAGKDKQTIQAETAYAAVAEYMKKTAAPAREFILLYTERNKNNGWEIFLKSPEMFQRPEGHFAFIRKMDAAAPRIAEKQA